MLFKQSFLRGTANKIRENINPISEKLQPRIIHGELQDMYYMFRTNRQSLFNIAVKTFIKSVESYLHQQEYLIFLPVS